MQLADKYEFLELQNDQFRSKMLLLFQNKIQIHRKTAGEMT